MTREASRSQTWFGPHLSPRYPRILTPTVEGPRTARSSAAQRAFASHVLSRERTQMLQSVASQALRDMKVLVPSEKAMPQNSSTQTPRVLKIMHSRQDSQSATLCNDPMRSGVSTMQNFPMRAGVSTIQSDSMGADVSKMETLEGLRISSLQTEDIRLHSLSQHAPMGSVIVAPRCQTSEATSDRMSQSQKTQPRGASSWSQQDTGTQMPQTIATQTSRHKIGQKKSETSQASQNRGSRLLQPQSNMRATLQNASTQTQSDVRALWRKDKMTATVHEMETQTSRVLAGPSLRGQAAAEAEARGAWERQAPLRRRTLILSDQDTQTEAPMSRRVAGKSGSSRRPRKRTSYASDSQTLQSKREKSQSARARSQSSR